MKRRIIKGQEGTPIQQQSDFQGLTQEDFEALQEYYRQYNLTNPQLRTNFDRSMEWLDQFRRDHNFISPETKQNIDDVLRYMGYVINPIVDPIGTASHYLQSSQWTPNWLKSALPYIDMGLSVAMAKGAPRRIKTGQATVSKGGKRLKPSEKYDEVVNNHRSVDDYGKPINDHTTGAPKPRKEWEVETDPYRWKLEAQQKKAEAAQAEQTNTKAPADTSNPESSSMHRTGSGRNTKAQNEKRNTMYERGTGIMPVTTKAGAKKALTNYYSAITSKVNRLLGQLTEFEQAGKVNEAADIRRQLKQTKSDFDAECNRVKTLGHEVNVPTELQDLMQFK